MSLRHAVAAFVALATFGSALAHADVTPPYQDSHEDHVCADHNSATIRACASAADAGTGSVTNELDIVSPDDGMGFGYGGASALAEIRQSFTTSRAQQSFSIEVRIHVVEARAQHSGLLTSSIGLVHSGYTGLANVYLHATASSACGVRLNFCYGTSSVKVATNRDPLNRTASDEDFVLTIHVSASDSRVIPSGTEFQVAAGAHTEVSLDTASGPDNGEVVATIRATVGSISIPDAE